jgi:hypothetical protein
MKKREKRQEKGNKRLKMKIRNNQQPFSGLRSAFCEISGAFMIKN